MEYGLVNLVVLKFEIGDGVLQKLLLRKKFGIEFLEHLVLPLEASLDIGIDGYRNDKIDHHRNHKGYGNHLQDEIQHPAARFDRLANLKVGVYSVKMVI